jgi:excinuclease UvrABC helicase subunit UvrB
MNRKHFNNLYNEFDSILNDFMWYGILPSIASTQTESGVDKNGEWKKTTLKTNDGRLQVTYFTRNGKETQPTQMSTLQSELNEAVSKQDFEKAVTLRDQINELKRSENKIKDLEGELREVIKSQNFERAIELRDQLNKLKSN